MYYVSLEHAESIGSFTMGGKTVEFSRQILGNLDLQGFYNYKRLSSVTRIINARKQAIANYRGGGLVWKVYQCTTQNMYTDFESKQRPVAIITATAERKEVIA